MKFHSMLFTLLVFFQSPVLHAALLADLIELSSDEQILFNTKSFDDLFAQGRKHKIAGQIQKALSCLKPALLKRPFDWPANWDLGDLYLALGDFKRGMAGFKFRWQHEKQFQEKLWLGQDLANKTVLIYCQWGLGDTFMYIRYASFLKKRGAYVICQAQKPLAKLLRYCPYIDQIIISSDPKPTFDYQLPTTYFPEVFDTAIDTIPNEIPYLFVDQKYIDEWSIKLGNKEKFRIGICWQGAVREDPQTAGRAMKLADLAAQLLKIENIEIYCLQQGYGSEQVNYLTAEDRKNIHLFNDHFDKDNGAFIDTAAVMKNLDLVLTIDTSIAHLAGALGVPTWVMLQYASEWRFFLERSDSPWYPTMRLFRQPMQGDWQTVINNVMNELQRIVK
ncbi:hypothetical protein HYX58_02350 [Candidatus Dependentiae bacterium]|nr:hypothetical protein [Candidatus Dependentiae bacterium]